MATKSPFDILNGPCNLVRRTTAPVIHLGISIPYFFLGRFDQAFHWTDRALQMKPRFGPVALVRLAALAMGGSHPGELRDAVQQLRSAHPDMSIATLMKRLPAYRRPIASCSRWLCARRDFQNKQVAPWSLLSIPLIGEFNHGSRGEARLGWGSAPWVIPLARYAIIDFL